MPKKLPGIHIQWPWSDLLISKKKIVETRSYPLPERFRGIEMAIIQTPGPRGRKLVGEACIIGTIVFLESFRYETFEAWKEDFSRHCVPPDDPQYRFQSERPKFGWVVQKVKKLKTPVPPPKKRGIVFARDCRIPGP